MPCLGGASPLGGGVGLVLYLFIILLCQQQGGGQAKIGSPNGQSERVGIVMSSARAFMSILYNQLYIHPIITQKLM